MQLLTLIVLIMSAVLLSALISPYIPKVSLPLVQIALGVIWYFLPFTPNLNLDDELYMILFIAPLLFFEAKGVSPRSLRRTISTSLSLAIGLVLFSVVATGFSLHALWGAISLPAAMALGAALGPTDAVAVSELRKEACSAAKACSMTPPASSASSSPSPLRQQASSQLCSSPGISHTVSSEGPRSVLSSASL